ncbi:MAG: hypothetical protein QOJ15_1171 [Bradyrhizobium sp.]|nr:hypothetical protein [Bradyrhizobium sp.]
MTLVLTLAVGDVVDIADYRIAVLSVDSRKTATLITKDGEKIPVSSKYETELVPTVWAQLGPWISKRKVKLLFDAPKSVSITRRKDRTA